MRLRSLLRYVGIGLGLALPACSGPPTVVMSSDFEQFDGWMAPPAFLSTEQAHSGRYSYRLADGAEFGGTFVGPLSGAAGRALPRQLRVSSWVYLTSGRVRHTQLVVQVLCHGRRPDVWQAISVDQVVPRYQKWEFIEKLVRLPAHLEPTDELKLYVWHPESNGEPTYFDDMRVEGWP